MEMQEIPAELETAEDLGASKQMLVTKTGEEAETEPYSKLQSPAEDVYSEAYYGSTPGKTNAGKQAEGNVRVYRAVCVLLALICLVFLVIVIVLGVKLQTGSTVCPETEKAAATDRSSSLESTCSRDQCNALFADTKPLYRECRQCADGWLTLDGSCFFLSTYKLNWEESQKNCTARGGTLAIVNNPTVQSFLTTEGRLKYWIGLKQSNDDWTWVNKTALGSSYWGGTWSSGGCAMLNSNQPADRNWFTASCQSYTYFICHLHL